MLAPPVDLALVGPSGPVPQQALRSSTLFGVGPLALSADPRTGVTGERLPVAGAEVVADYAATPLARLTPTLVIRTAGKELVSRPIDLRAME